MALLVMLCLELTATPAPVLHGFGMALLAGRLAHAWGFGREPGRSAGRVVGTLLTWAVVVGGGLLLLGRRLAG
jgi:uncharacterized membrane protein YecN with MAPEG domain